MVSMEAVQSQWFRCQWNHNETEVLRGFTVHAVDITHALLGRPQKYTEGWSSQNQCICVLTKHLLSGESYEVTQVKTFDQYAVEQYIQSKMLACSSKMGFQWDLLLINHHRCSVANIIAKISVTEGDFTYFCSLPYIMLLNMHTSSDNLWFVLITY